MATPFPALDGSAPRKQQFDSAPEMGIDPAKRYTATMDTQHGHHRRSRSTRSTRPLTVNNFVFLAAHHYYDGVIFHRIINGFMCQGGDPTGTGRGGPGYKFDDEPVKQQYQIGSVAMANAGPEHQRQPVLPDQWSQRGQPAAAVQPLRSDREGPRRARRDAEGRHRPQRPAARRRGHQLGHHHRRRLTAVAVRDHLARARRAASRSARRASPNRARRAGSTAGTSAACWTGWV